MRDIELLLHKFRKYTDEAWVAFQPFSRFMTKYYYQTWNNLQRNAIVGATANGNL